MPGRDWTVVRHQPWWIAKTRLWLASALVIALGGILAMAAVQSRPGRSRTGLGGSVAAIAGLAHGPAATPAPSGPPVRLVIPAISVDTTLELLDLDRTGALNAPASFTRAGWYEGGPAPGDQGPAVIAGHVDSRTGPAVFYRLHELANGASIRVQRGDTWLTFIVVNTERYPKNDFPVARVYGPTPGPQLRLITCGGSYDPAARTYRDNIVVYAIER